MYAPSFPLNQKKEYLQFFKENGYVVVDNVISEQDCEKSVDAIWNLVKRSSVESCIKDQPETWGDNWPTSKTGILGDGIVQDPQAWKNRQNKNIYDVFSTLYNDSDLIVSLDRYGITRPTVNIPINGKLVNKPEWSGLQSWFHWDLNPWLWSGVTKRDYELPFDNYNTMDPFVHQRIITHFIIENNNIDNTGNYKLQGLVAFADTNTDTGGFQCVPGFNVEQLKEWCERNMENAEKYKKAHFVPVPKEDELIKQGQVIGIRKGSLLVWSSTLPHCNRDNRSSVFRYCQYIKLMQASTIPCIEDRAAFIERNFPALKNVEITPTGEQVFGLDKLEKKNSRRRKLLLTIPVMVAIVAFVAVKIFV